MKSGKGGKTVRTSIYIRTLTTIVMQTYRSNVVLILVRLLHTISI